MSRHHHIVQKLPWAVTLGSILFLHEINGNVDVMGPWLTSVEAAKEFEIVSIASHLDPGNLNRTNLLSDFPLKVRILGLDRDLGVWKNLHKLTLLHDHVARLPPWKIVFVLDFFDVVWLDCAQDLVEAFRRFGKPLVFSADFEPYPMTNASIQRLPGGYPLLLGAQHDSDAVFWVRRRHAGRHHLRGHRSYRFLNSGCFAGYASALKAATGRMLANDLDNEYILQSPLPASHEEYRSFLIGRDDQIAWHAYAVRHPDEVALDYRADLFLSVYGFAFQDFELKKHKIWVRPFGHDVCFAHGNGASNLAIHLLLTQRFRVQPHTCWNAVVYSLEGQSHYMDCAGL